MLVRTKQKYKDIHMNRTDFIEQSKGGYWKECHYQKYNLKPNQKYMPLLSYHSF